MQCDAFQHRLDELLDQRKKPAADPSLADHAQSCPHCQETLRATESWLYAVDIPDGEAAQRFTGPTTRLTPSLPSQAMRAGVLAVTLLIAVSVWWMPRPQNTPPAEPSHRDVTLVHNPSETVFVHQPIVGLSLLSRADWSRLDETNVPFAAHVPQWDTDWLQQVADEMQPVQESMFETLDVLRRSLMPLGRTPSVAING